MLSLSQRFCLINRSYCSGLRLIKGVLTLGLIFLSQVLQAQSPAPIWNAGDLASLRSKNGSFELKDNILLNGTLWTPIGDTSNPFSGTFNGNGFFIDGLNVSATGSAGLFGVMSDSRVGNLTLFNPVVVGYGDKQGAGALTGEALNTTIHNVSSFNGKVIKYGSGSLRPMLSYQDYTNAGGGIIGIMRGGHIKGSFSSGLVRIMNSSTWGGGIVGAAFHSGGSELHNNNTVESVYYSNGGGTFGLGSGSSFENLINTGRISSFGGTASGIGSELYGTQISKALNAGEISLTAASGTSSDGVTGQSLYSQSDKAAGIAATLFLSEGWTEGSSIQNSINIGTVTSVDHSYGISSHFYCYDKPLYPLASSISNVVNIGSVSCEPDTSKSSFTNNGCVSIGIGTSCQTRLAINAGNVTATGVSGEAFAISGGTTNINQTLNVGVIEGNKVGICSGCTGSMGNNYWSTPEITGVRTDLATVTGLDGVDNKKWHFGNSGQYPMLTGINKPWQEILRMGLPLNFNASDYAFPDKDLAVSFFDSEVWILKDGYWPMLKMADKAYRQAIASGVDSGIICGKGAQPCVPLRRIEGSYGAANYLIEFYPDNDICLKPIVSISCQYYDGTAQSCGKVTLCTYQKPSECNDPASPIQCVCPECPSPLESSPFIPITNATALQEMGSGNYALVNDIDLSNYSWKPVGNASHPFIGLFDGQGHFILGLDVEHDGNAGLFGVLLNSQVGNLTLIQPRVHGQGYTAALAGQIKHSMVEQVAVFDGAVTNTGTGEGAAGLIAGKAVEKSFLENVQTVGGTVSTVKFPGGGIVGVADHSSMATAFNSAMISSGGKGGGLLGLALNESDIKNGTNVANVTTDGFAADVGGICGALGSKSSIQHVVNLGNVTARSGTYSDSGGAAGEVRDKSKVSFVVNAGNIVANGTDRSDSGGGAGCCFHGQVDHVFNLGDVTAHGRNSQSGGGAGYAQAASNISYIHNLGSVQSNVLFQDSHPGGGVGKATDSQIQQLINQGEVAGFHPRGAVGYGNFSGAYWLKPDSDQAAGYKTNEQLKTGSDSTGLSSLDPQEWNLGSSSQYPLLSAISVLLQDLLRLTEAANLSDFDLTESNLTLSILDPKYWIHQTGYWPLLKLANKARQAAELKKKQIGIQCAPGAFSCLPTCLVNPDGVVDSDSWPDVHLDGAIILGDTGEVIQPIQYRVYYGLTNQWLMEVSYTTLGTEELFKKSFPIDKPQLGSDYGVAHITLEWPEWSSYPRDFYVTVSPLEDSDDYHQGCRLPERVAGRSYSVAVGEHNATRVVANDYFLVGERLRDADLSEGSSAGQVAQTLISCHEALIQTDFNQLRGGINIPVDSFGVHDAEIQGSASLELSCIKLASENFQLFIHTQADMQQSILESDSVTRNFTLMLTTEYQPTKNQTVDWRGAVLLTGNNATTPDLKRGADISLKATITWFP